MQADAHLIAILGKEAQARDGRGEPVGLESADLDGVLLDHVAQVVEGQDDLDPGDPPGSISARAGLRSTESKPGVAVPARELSPSGIWVDIV